MARTVQSMLLLFAISLPALADFSGLPRLYQPQHCSRYFQSLTDFSISRDRMIRQFVADSKIAPRLFTRDDARALGIAADFNHLKSKLSRLGPDFENLLRDPRILAHIREVNRALEKKKDFRSPEELISLLRVRLGNKTVYRALRLTDDQLAATKTNGILAPRATATESQLRQMEEDLPLHQENATQHRVQSSSRNEPPHADNYINNFQFHRSGYSSTSNLMSVSDYPPLSTAVAARYAQDPSEKIRLFQIRISSFDMIDIGPGSIFQNRRNPTVLQKLYNWLGIGPNPVYQTGRDPTLNKIIRVHQGGKTFEIPGSDPGVERLIFMKINPEEIEEVRTLSIEEAGVLDK